MKIGILTYHSAHNFGAALQAYSLQRELERMGHDAKFVNFHPPYVQAKNERKVEVRSLRDLAKKFAFSLLGGKLRRRYENFEEFRSNCLNQTGIYESFEELKENPPGMDAYVCGSDQIWNLEHGPSPVYYLQFVEEGRLAVAYAPSFGSSAIPDEYDGQLRGWLDKITHLSARELSGRDKLASLTGRPVTQVMDPVFLTAKSDWEKVARRPSIQGEYLVYYSLETTRTASEVVEHLSRRFKLPVVVVGKAGSFLFRCRTLVAIDSGPREFLGWILGAKMVVTNSFHATAFSVWFGVPFVTIAHSTKNTRMESLLGMVGLEGRMIHGVDEVAAMADSALLAGWEEGTVRRLEGEIARSRDFLVASLAG